MKFKAKKIESDDISDLLGVLSTARFYNESVFWCQKILEHLKVNDNAQRTRTIGHICLSYGALGNNEKCMEYGEKYLALLDSMFHTDLKQK